MRPEIIASKTLVVLVYLALVAQAGLMAKKGIDILRLPAKIRAERFPVGLPFEQLNNLTLPSARAPESRPTTATTAPSAASATVESIDASAILALMVKSRNQWALDQQDRINAALARRPVGLLLLFLGLLLFSAWSWLIIWIWPRTTASDGPSDGNSPSPSSPASGA